MGALINMICELEITSGSKKNCVKNSQWSDISLKSYQRKTVLRGHEIHSSASTVTSVTPANFDLFGRDIMLITCGRMFETWLFEFTTITLRRLPIWVIGELLNLIVLRWLVLVNDCILQYYGGQSSLMTELFYNILWWPVFVDDWIILQYYGGQSSLMTELFYNILWWPVFVDDWIILQYFMVASLRWWLNYFTILWWSVFVDDWIILQYHGGQSLLITELFYNIMVVSRRWWLNYFTMLWWSVVVDDWIILRYYGGQSLTLCYWILQYYCGQSSLMAEVSEIMLISLFCDFLVYGQACCGAEIMVLSCIRF